MMTEKVRVVPAILTDDPIDLGKMVFVTESFTDFAQVDIMDGQFVPSTSVTCQDIATLSTRLHWEAHLMVMHPENYLEEFKKAGAEKIIFHYEATPSPETVIDLIRKLDMEAGLAVNPETPVSAFAPLVKSLDSILFMSVVPGYYGAKFIPEVLDKITDFKRAHPVKSVGIDGGIKESNITTIAEGGVNDICVGSAIFLQPNPAEAYRKLTRLAELYAP
jgi:ribulose-phosphate 3-epimerase